MVPRHRILTLASVLVASAATATGASPPPASASTAAPRDVELRRARQRELAKRHFDRSRAYLDAHRFDLAIDELQAGYTAEPLPLFLFNIATVARVAARMEMAADYFRRYLDSSAPANAPERVEARRWLERYDAQSSRAARPTPVTDEQSSASLGKTTAPGTTTPSAPPAPRTNAPPPAVHLIPVGSLTLVNGTHRAEPMLGVTAERRAQPVYKKWWLWTSVAVVVGAGLGLGLGFGLSRSSSYPPIGRLGTVLF